MTPLLDSHTSVEKEGRAAGGRRVAEEKGMRLVALARYEIRKVQPLIGATGTGVR